MRKVLFLLIGAVALLLAACSMDFHTKFDTPQSGTIEIVWTTTAEEAQMLQSMGSGTVEDMCNEMKSDMGKESENVTVEFSTDDNGNNICTVRGPFNSLQDLQDAYGEEVTVNRIGEENGKFYYDITYDSSADDLGGLGTGPIALHWRVTMPGKVLESNGDKVEGNTVTWNLSGSGEHHLRAVSKIGGFNLDSKTLGLLALCLCLPLLLLIVAVIVWLVVRKKKQTQSTAAVAPETNTPAETPPADWTE